MVLLLEVSTLSEAELAAPMFTQKLAHPPKCQHVVDLFDRQLVGGDLRRRHKPPLSNAVV